MSGASLKLSILNPGGRIWTMVAGGGASVIYADTVGDLGLAHELGNYAEYSGAPNTAETYAYAKTLLDWCAPPLSGRGQTGSQDSEYRSVLCIQWGLNHDQGWVAADHHVKGLNHPGLLEHRQALRICCS